MKGHVTLSLQRLLQEVLIELSHFSPCSQRYKNEHLNKVFKEHYASIYVIVMGIIKCEKVFAGIFIFSSLFKIKILLF